MRETMAEKVAALAVFALLGVLMAGVLIEWAAGCGEHYVDSKGVTHQNECVFIRRD